MNEPKFDLSGIQKSLKMIRLTLQEIRTNNPEAYEYLVAFLMGDLYEKTKVQLQSVSEQMLKAHLQVLQDEIKANPSDPFIHELEEMVRAIKELLPKK